MESLACWPNPQKELRAALGRVRPQLAREPLALNAQAKRFDPTWHSGSAVIGDAFVAKFAWSQPAAARVHREGQVLVALRSTAAHLPLPEVVATSADPVVVITRLVAGGPLAAGALGALDDARSDRIAAQIAGFLAALHDPTVLEKVRPAAPLMAPEPQADTDALRERFGRWVSRQQQRAVVGWCDWVDTVLAKPSPSEVLVHGDLHGHNQLWDLSSPRLCAVVDFDIAGPRDPEFDFRYLPSQTPDSGLFIAAVRHYQQRSGRTLDLDRVMAWHIRTVLGDALWRSEAGVALPGGDDPSTWVNDLKRRLRKLEVGRHSTK